MRCIDGLPEPGAVAGPTAVTVGVFDGLHRGHEVLLRRARERADEVRGKAVALTFRQHPAALLHGEAPLPLQTIDARLEGFEAAGIDVAVVVDFDERLRSINATAFADQVLREGLGCVRLVMGFDSAICHHREGTVERFRSLGLKAERIAPVLIDGERVSSSLIRKALAAGDVQKAATLLGRDHAVAGRVEHGAARGREIGFKTANLVPPALCLPAHGVYAARCAHGAAEHPAVVNLGRRPSFDGDAIVLEVHILDFDADLYGEELTIRFAARIRPERRFASKAELHAQITRDIDAARRRLSA